MADGAPSLRPDEFSLGARLEQLLDILAGEGLIISARERTAAHLLFVHEMEAAAGPDAGAAVSPARERELLTQIAPVLAPLLARTREEREKFFRVMDTLYPALAAGSTSASAGSQGETEEPEGPWIRRHWGKLIGLAVLLVLGLAGAWLFLQSQKQPEVVARVLSDVSTPQILGKVAEAATPAQPEERKPQTSDRLLARIMAAAEAHEGAATLREVAAQVFGDPESLGRVNSETEALSLGPLDGHTGAVYSAAFSPDGRRALTASADGTARIWDAESRTVLLTLKGHTDAVNSAAFSPDGRRVLTASSDKTARVWDGQAGAALRTLQGHRDAVFSTDFSPDGRRILTASSDRTARLWDAETGAPLQTLAGHEDALTSAVFSPDGRRILTASADKTARLWDAETGALLRTLQGHTNTVYSAVFSPDGRLILTASGDKTARLWDAESVALLRTLEGHTSTVYSAVFSPDGRRILTASSDTTARLWDAESGAALRTLEGRSGVVLSAAFSPDGRRILTTNLDNTARLWDASLSPAPAGLSWTSGAYAQRLSELTGLPLERPLPLYGTSEQSAAGSMWARLAQALGRIEQPGLEPPLNQLKEEAAASLAPAERPRAYRVFDQLRTVFPNPSALAGSPTTPAMTAGEITAKLIEADAGLDYALRIGEGPGEDIARALAMAGYPTVAFHHVPWESQPVRPASTPPPDWLPWVALAMPLVAALWFARSLFLMRPYLRRRPPRIPPTHTELVSEAGKRANVDAGYFQRVAQRLRVRTSRPSTEIDVAATIAATLRSGGLIVEPVQARARARPDYLVLVERMGAGDHDALRMQRLIERLSELVDLDIYAFQYDPGEIEPWGGGRRITIEEAQARHPDHRLIVLGTGSGLLDPLTLEPREAARKLMYWPRRVLLTPMPLAEWGREEYALAEGLAMPVGRATAEGLQFLAELLGLEGSEAEAQPDPRGDGLARPLPDLLRLRPQRFLFNNPPDKATVAQLVTELRNVLTPAEFDWFASLAIYPSVQWDLTLFLGVYLPLRDTDELIVEPATGPAELQKLQAPAEPLYGEGRLAAIAQLPWLRAGKMPNWLRTLLIRELSPKRAAQVRRVLQKALESSRPRDAATREEEAVFRIAEDRVRNEPRKEALAAEKVFDDDVLLDFLTGAQRGDFSVTRLPRIDGRFLRNFWQQLGGPGGLAGLAALAFGVTGYFVAPRGPGPALTGAYGPLLLLAIGAVLAAGFWRPAALGRSTAGLLERVAPGAFALGFATLPPTALMMTPLAGALRETLLTPSGEQIEAAGAAWAQAAAGFLALSVLSIAGLLLARWLGERLALRIHAAPLNSLGRWLVLLAKGLAFGGIGFWMLRASAGVSPAGLALVWPVVLLLVAALGIPAARFAPEAATIARAAAREERGSGMLPVALRFVLTALPMAAAIALSFNISQSHDRRQLLAGAGEGAAAMHPERVAVSADGGAIVSVDAAGQMVLSQAEGGVIAAAEVKAPVTALVIGGAAEARKVAFADADGHVFLWPAGGKPAPVMTDGGPLQSFGAPAQLAFGPDGVLLAAVETAGADGRATTLLNREGRLLAADGLVAPPAALTGLDAGHWALATLNGQVHHVTAPEGAPATIAAMTWSGGQGDHPPVRMMVASGGDMALRLVGIDGSLVAAEVTAGKWGELASVGQNAALALGPMVAWRDRPETIVPAVPQPAPAAQARIALVIAIDDYQTPGWRLRSSQASARVVANALQQAGFMVTLLNNASRRDITQSIRDLQNQIRAAGPGTAALVYYAGQGDPAQGGAQIVPRDAREPLAASDTIDFQDVLASLGNAGAATMIGIYDAPHGKPKAARPGMLLAYSDGAGAATEDTTTYADALAATITTPGLSAGAVFNSVSRRVAAASNSRPYFESALAQDFLFTPAAARSTGPVVQRPTPTQDSLQACAAPADYIVFFNQDRDTLSAEAETVISAAVSGITESGCRITGADIVGYADSGEQNRDRLALSRANAVGRRFERLGINWDGRAAQSGSEGATSAGISDPQNRRAMFKLVATKVSVETLAAGTIFRDRIANAPQTAVPEMVVLPAGNFLMGSPATEADRDEDEGPQRRVSVPAFAAGKYEVTWTEYEACVAARACEAAKDDGFGKGSRPVTNVSWDDAVAYARWLSRATGQTYRLLSEAEWEYAARAGSSGRWSFGDDDRGALGSFAWYSSNSGSATHAVGTRGANAFGLFDMHGNVYEWVEDCYAAYDAGKLDASPVATDETGKVSQACSSRVIRGGSWNDDPRYLRSAYRVGDAPTGRDNDLGFRVARTLSSTP